VTRAATHVARRADITHARRKSVEQLSVQWLVLQLIEYAPDVFVRYLVVAGLVVVAFVSVHVRLTLRIVAVGPLPPALADEFTGSGPKRQGLSAQKWRGKTAPHKHACCLREERLSGVEYPCRPSKRSDGTPGNFQDRRVQYGETPALLAAGFIRIAWREVL